MAVVDVVGEEGAAEGGPIESGRPVTLDGRYSMRVPNPEIYFV